MTNATTHEPSTLKDLTRSGGYLEYSKASNPQAAGAITPVPILTFPASLHASGPSRILPLDISQQLQCECPASSPSLLASFVRINAGDSLSTSANATSQLFYVLSGSGSTRFGEHEIPYRQGDLFTLPGGPDALHAADSDSVFYWVNDAPLLQYLGVTPATPRFSPTLYVREESRAALAEAASDSMAAKRSRISVLLTNQEFPQTLTITHVLWAMLGILPVGANQLPHAHKSVAVDLILDCKPGCYTLVSEKADSEGNLINPIKVPWESGGAFITPPGYWHSHHNESGEPAYLMPIQDAGLHTYLRTLDIQFHRLNVV
ncbi:MAG: cupin [Planctomycetes bacterium]|nr:cupin [Planctomycetota bacterium]